MAEIYNNFVNYYMTTKNADKLKLTFKKHERLKSRKIIQTLFVKNKNIKIYPFKLVWVTEHNNKLTLKIGVSVSKKLFKSAVVRNKIKRKMREAIRLNKHLLLQNLSDNNITLSFMIVYMENKDIAFGEYNLKIKQLFIRLADIIKK
jgi:ribonuclease P protein component